MFFHVWILFLLLLVNTSLADHYKGGTLSWKPTNPYSLTSPVEITITERHSWTLARYQCNESTINSLGVYNDTQNEITATIICISSTATCTSSLFQNISSSLYCTDFSTEFQISTGTYYTKQYLAINSIIDVASRGAAWASETLTNEWSLVTHIDLTPISGKINTSPVTASLPIFQFYVNELSVIQILAADWDYDQVVRCRWSYQYSLDECGSTCFDLPNAQLNSVDCAITWTPVLRSADIANGLTQSTYVVAITVEDFVNASSTTPLSSVPHQILVYVSYRPTNTCTTRPSITDLRRRNLACYALSVGYPINFIILSTVNCRNDSIVEFISTSPFRVQKGNIFQQSNYTWAVSFSWTPLNNQTGLQPFCIAAVDNNGQTSSQNCVMIAVGATNPSIIAPTFVQSTASPVGTVMPTQSRFSIQTTLPLRRTRLNGTYIDIYQLNTYALFHRLDCKYSPDVYFINKTLIFFIHNPSWVLGATYYIVMTEGVATADQYCGVEAGSFYGYNSWRFTIWNSAMSSTTTPSTTTSTATTHTVTTRFLGTTTYNTLYTTTGIPAYTTSTTTSTTSTTATTATTTTTTSVTTATTTTTTTTDYNPDANVIYPKDMERACLQPVTIVTVIVTIAVIPLHFVGMTTLFVQMNSLHQQEILRARSARRKRLRQALELEEEQTLV
ncbi:unnamed protein product [Rotaria sordida]|uniref:Membrane-associated protein n=1 Tax=Rotaria sordida TaxID=392033 RepID=A0A814MX31_9BILA|nr:unnamed protein product [Rotaria sordida]